MTVVKFAKETDLCAAFLEGVDQRLWTAYAETAGWDLLMVRKADGFQIGIQAKLRLNTDVINQAIERYHSWSPLQPGPDCRAVLVPQSNGFTDICAYLGIVVVVVRPGYYGSPRWAVTPPLPPTSRDVHLTREWPEWAPDRRHDLPEYIPDVPAGASAPVQLTDWKIKALKIAVLLAERGFVTRKDFAALKVDPRRWIAGEWLVRDGQKMTKGRLCPDFRKQHPKVYEQIAADAKWRPKPEPESEGLL